ncbi:unnamed protein product [Ceratitis capitata]|uniref:(Mediterranean fruit fly) hypothetical protein n=1 Tax=Ceratitis capitata TaxID=7213 RepID=W8CEE8_CERCA|nr:unnamed protein product [Ceratitis capitata]
MKIIVRVCVLFALLAVAYSASSSWGTPNGYDDYIFLKKQISYPPVRNVAQTFFFSIPESYQSNDRVITAILLEDGFRNNSGPTNYLLAGGPGWTYANVQMRTQTGFGLNVTYTVYGKYVK